MRIIFNKLPEEEEPDPVKRAAKILARQRAEMYPEYAEMLHPRPEDIPACTCGKPYQESGRVRDPNSKYFNRKQYNRKHTPECPYGLFWAERNKDATRPDRGLRPDNQTNRQNRREEE